LSLYVCCAAVAVSLACGQATSAAQVSVTVHDGAGGPVGDAVVALHSTSGNAPTAPVVRNVTLDQFKKQFVPHVLAIQAGTTISFPNSDNIRHQVYSFSEAKRFELKLYSGKSADPIVFDRPGVVVLGCNIHDWMSAYLYVVDTPYFALTDKDGHAVIQAPMGNYTARIWHPRFRRGRESFDEDIQVARDSEELRETLTLAAADDSNGIPPASQ
jgi:plastocyanin